MIVTKQNLQDKKIKFNIDRFIKSRLTPGIYFKYFYENPPTRKEVDFSSIQLPTINRMFIKLDNIL